MRLVVQHVRIARSFLPLLVCMAAGGCYRYVPVEVRCIGARSGQPIGGVNVQPDYARFVEFFPPDLRVVRSDANGKAVVPVCVNYKSGMASLSFGGDYFIAGSDNPG